MQGCKPDSVSPKRPLPFISTCCHQQAPSTYPSCQQCYKRATYSLRGQGLFGLSAHKVYHATIVTNSPVSSYLTISPLPTGALAKEGIINPNSQKPRCRRFIFCCTFCHKKRLHLILCLPVRKCGTLCCPDFPHRNKFCTAKHLAFQNYNYCLRLQSYSDD